MKNVKRFYNKYLPKPWLVRCAFVMSANTLLFECFEGENWVAAVYIVMKKFMFTTNNNNMYK